MGVMASFITENPKTYYSLVKAMVEACQFATLADSAGEYSAGS
ncbi:MAG: ABC transporter substrate-binding protein [Microcoleus sp. SU_5_3]|nr:ABC transporter substrate-binding protein [Microcoleus sp. SU_5_3]